jgi:hypothetical protein
MTTHVVRVDVNLIEELDGDAIITTFAEVLAILLQDDVN